MNTIFNLCNVWVTDTCYHNKRIVNLETGNNSILLGPTLFHFTKDDKTFLRLALERLDTEPELINLKTIGADIEHTIAKGFKRIIPNIKLLYCVRHQVIHRFYQS